MPGLSVAAAVSVIAHPTTNDGIRIALASGVDILAHTTIDEEPAFWPPQQDASRFVDVCCAVRQGRVIYRQR